MSGTRSRLLAIALAAVVLVSAVALGVGAAPVLADDHEPPEVPASYYGDVYLDDGEPAPEGTVVTAVVAGEERGSIVVAEEGQFGGPGIDEEKLEVPGSSGDGEVTFLVNGEEVDTDPSTVEWEAGDLQEVELVGDDVAEAEFQVSIDEDASTTDIQPGDSASIEAVVENAGDAAGPADLEFVVDGGPFEDDVVDKQTVEVAPGETQRVPFAIQLDEEGDYDATVDLVHFGSDSTTITVDDGSGAAPPPIAPPAPPSPADPNIQVVKAGLSAEQIDVGDDVNVTATLENLGSTGTHAVSLTVDGDEVRTEEVTLEAGEETTIAFTETFDEAGEYTIAVDGTRAGTLTVGSADIHVTSASVSDTEVSTGESVEVTGIVGNGGDVAGDATVELLIDGDVVDSQIVTVDAAGTADVTFTHAFDDEGEYDVALNDASAGTVSVSDDDGDDGSSIPGFTPAVAVLALLTVVAIGRFRAD